MSYFVLPRTSKTQFNISPYFYIGRHGHFKVMYVLESWTHAKFTWNESVKSTNGSERLVGQLVSQLNYFKLNAHQNTKFLKCIIDSSTMLHASLTLINHSTEIKEPSMQWWNAWQDVGESTTIFLVSKIRSSFEVCTRTSVVKQ